MYLLVLDALGVGHDKSDIVTDLTLAVIDD